LFGEAMFALIDGITSFAKDVMPSIKANMASPNKNPARGFAASRMK